MRFLTSFLIWLHLTSDAALGSSQIPLIHQHDRAVSPRLFGELEELARIVDISYCVGLTNTGISKPFTCLSRCADFPQFELIKSWNTGPLMSDSCGYLALDHSKSRPRIIVAFRGTYSIANAVIDLSTIPQEYAPYPGDPNAGKGDSPKCNNCTVHSGFYHSWRVTSDVIKPELDALLLTHPNYHLHLVGHSLGGAVAALAGLDFLSQGWNPIVTTYGEPRIGNKALTEYIDGMFKLNYTATTASFHGHSNLQEYEASLRFRRVTHIDDPVPQLPLSEWGFRMHAGEIFITKSSLSPDLQDIQHCFGDEDPECIASQDNSLTPPTTDIIRRNGKDDIADTVGKASLWGSTGGGLTIPARYKLWQMLFAHRDYFWRLGLCVPSGTPWGWLEKPVVEAEAVE